MRSPMLLPDDICIEYRAASIRPAEWTQWLPIEQREHLPHFAVETAWMCACAQGYLAATGAMEEF